MATVESIANDAIADVQGDVSLLLAARWVNRRYREMVSKVRFRHLRRVGSFTIPAAIEAGTVSVSVGGIEVTGNATARAAWSNALVGRYFRGKVAWYEIVGVTSTPSLILASAYSEDALSSSGYTVVARHVLLNPKVRWLGSIVFMRRRHPLKEMSLDELTILHPDRRLLSYGPTVYAEVGMETNSEGQRARMIEVYPYSEQAEAFHYVYWEEPPVMGLREEIPRVIDDFTLIEGTLVDVMRYQGAQAAHEGKSDEAAYWRNEYRAQETKWKQYIKDAARTDRGGDDLSFILDLERSHSRADIQNAHDQVYANWPR